MTTEEDDLPPELRSAWAQRQREQEQATEDQESGSEDAHDEAPPGAGAPAHERPAVPQPPPAPPRRASPWRAFLILPVSVAVAAGVAWSGIAGWKAGPALAAGALLSAIVPCALVLTRGVVWRGAYLIGALLVALAGVAVAVDVAPLSHGRLEERLDPVNLPFASPSATERSGHGWCAPRCPTVVKELRMEGRRASALYKPVVVAADAAGLVPADPQRTFLARALSYEHLGRGVVIDHREFTTTIRLRDQGDTAVVVIELTSRRGVKEQPDAPQPLRE
ncbi:MAG TPA: hypothetical protein VM345_11170 [Acidimicrobiales bacterium]|jgi:hypothetical protein|nr:hypothetical protein [Acidimicrobiales bacterium]